MSVLVPGECVRMERSEDVTNPRARDGFQHHTTLPDSEAHFKIFSSPDVHLRIVGAESPESVSRNSKEAASHGWRPGGCYRASPASQLARRNVNPSEMARPCEPANLEVVAVAVIVFQRLVVNDVNDWHNKSLWVLLDSS